MERMFTGGRGLTASVGAGLSSGQGIWGPPDGLQPLSHCEDPQQCILLPHQAVGRGRERVLPAPPPLVIKGKWSPENWGVGLRGSFTHGSPSCLSDQRRSASALGWYGHRRLGHREFCTF